MANCSIKLFNPLLIGTMRYFNPLIHTIDHAIVDFRMFNIFLKATSGKSISPNSTIDYLTVTSVLAVLQFGRFALEYTEANESIDEISKQQQSPVTTAWNTIKQRYVVCSVLLFAALGHAAISYNSLYENLEHTDISHFDILWVCSGFVPFSILQNIFVEGSNFFKNIHSLPQKIKDNSVVSLFVVPISMIMGLLAAVDTYHMPLVFNDKAYHNLSLKTFMALFASFNGVSTFIQDLTLFTHTFFTLLEKNNNTTHTEHSHSRFKQMMIIFFSISSALFRAISMFASLTLINIRHISTDNTKDTILAWQIISSFAYFMLPCFLATLPMMYRELSHTQMDSLLTSIKNCLPRCLSFGRTDEALQPLQLVTQDQSDDVTLDVTIHKPTQSAQDTSTATAHEHAANNILFFSTTKGLYFCKLIKAIQIHLASIAISYGINKVVEQFTKPSSFIELNIYTITAMLLHGFISNYLQPEHAFYNPPTDGGQSLVEAPLTKTYNSYSAHPYPKTSLSIACATLVTGIAINNKLLANNFTQWAPLLAIIPPALYNIANESLQTHSTLGMRTNMACP